MPGHYNYPTPPPPPEKPKPKPPKLSPRDKKAPSANEETPNINPNTGMAEGWGGGAPREGSSKKKWYGTGP